MNEHLRNSFSNPVVIECLTVYNNTCSSIDFLSNENHNKDYKLSIRKTPCFACSSCDNILFSDQIRHIKVEAQIMSLVFTNKNELCGVCYLKADAIYVVKRKFLDVGNIPNELTCMKVVSSYVFLRANYVSNKKGKKGKKS